MKDSFAAGVEPGGLYSSGEIRILLCYLLMGVGEPMQQDTVLAVVTSHGMANFFETSAAIEELIRLGNIREEDGLLHLTESGRQAASTLESRIPYTLRERSVKTAVQMLTRMRREKETQVSIEKCEQGCQIHCTILDRGSSLMSLSLRVADEMQASLIKESFLDETTLLYRSIIAILTGDAGMKKSDTQIVIDIR